MRLQLLSDIHLEFPKAATLMPSISPKAPILALLGDIGYPGEQHYNSFVLQQANQFQYVLLVAGNHEYYNNRYDKVHKAMEELCQQRDNIYFMNKTALDLPEYPEYRILGTTLWSNIPRDYQFVTRLRCNDYRKIEISGPGESFHRMTIDEQNALHSSDVQWLTGELDKAREQNKKLAVLTHHAPTDEHAVHPDFLEDELRFIAFTKLDHLMVPPLKLWAFGHTHYCCDRVIGCTRVVSNQLGYIHIDQSDPRFDPHFVVDLA